MKQCRSCGVAKPPSDFYTKDPDCKSCRSEINKEKYQQNKDAFKNKELKKAYGITLDDFKTMLSEQEGCCAICGTSACSTNKQLAVDHCHDTGKVRGLLCANCNTAIGKLKDNYDLVYRAADYLRAASI